MTYRNWFLWPLVALAPACATVSPSQDIFDSVDQDSTHWTSLERASVRTAEINWHNASAPFRRYILISDGEFLCAIRFVNFRRGRDASAGSFWSSGEETLTSAYEWNLLERDGSRVKVKSNGRSTVQFTAPKGFGHLVVAGGYGNVSCGKREFGWRYPSAIVFSQTPNSRMRLAPSRWSAIEEIRLDDAKLRWYSFDQDRKPIRIPLDDL